MISESAFKALRAATEVAYSGDEPEHEQMHKDAMDALDYIRGAIDAPRAAGNRWRFLRSSANGAGILQCVKGIMGLDPKRVVVVLPEVDFARWSARTVFLEDRHIEMSTQIVDLTNQLTEALANAKDAEYVAADPSTYQPSNEQPLPEDQRVIDEIEDIFDRSGQDPLRGSVKHDTSGIGPDDEVVLSKFQEHVNRCARCQVGPASMCQIGKMILAKSTSGT